MFDRFPSRRVLVVEDDPIIALDVGATLATLEVEVVGPLASVTPALRVIASGPLDAAVLDINLGKELSFPIADALAVAAVPFIFVTGCNSTVIPVAHRIRLVLPKPFVRQNLIAAVARILSMHSDEST